MPWISEGDGGRSWYDPVGGGIAYVPDEVGKINVAPGGIGTLTPEWSGGYRVEGDTAVYQRNQDPRPGVVIPFVAQPGDKGYVDPVALTQDEKPWYDRILPGDQDTPGDLLPGFLDADPGDTGIVPFLDPFLPGDQDTLLDFTPVDEVVDGVVGLKQLIPLLALGAVAGGGIGMGVQAYSSRRKSRRKGRR